MPTPRPALILLCAALLCGACATGERSVADLSVPSTARTTTRAVALAVLQPCGLLSQADTERLHYTGRTPVAAPGSRACVWNAANPDDSMTITFGTVRVADLQPPTTDITTDYTIGSHRGVRIQAADAARCTLVVDIGARESVSVQAVTSSTAEDACRRVVDVSELIEPSLP